MTGAEPSLGSTLRSTREARGIDLARVQRDTRIQFRYLLALEDGDYGDLPEPLYVRGFIRLYASYLELDPTGLLARYERETRPPSSPRTRSANEPPPRQRPVGAGHLVLTSTRLGVALIAVGVAALGIYLGYELITFARTPELRLTAPAADLAAYSAETITVSGQTAPNATVTLSGLRHNPDVTADGEGRFTVVVQLVPGSNVITVVAHDPVTDRDSSPAVRTVTVVVPVPSPSLSPIPNASPSSAAG